MAGNRAVAWRCRGRGGRIRRTQGPRQLSPLRPACDGVPESCGMKESDSSMDRLTITAGPFAFGARLETALAPKTCAKFRSVLPYDSKVIHVRWSGEGV